MAEKTKKEIYLTDQGDVVKKYDLQNKVILGEGAFGQVFKVKNNYDGKFYAIKLQNVNQKNE